MSRVAVVLLAAACVLAACGGSAESEAPAGTTGASSAPPPAQSAADGPTLAALLGTPDATTLSSPNLIVLGGTDFPAGRPTRIPFQVYRKDGELLTPDRDGIRLYLGASATSPALGPYPVRWYSLKGPGVRFEDEDADSLLVASDVPLPASGTWNMVVTMEVDGQPTTATNMIAVLPEETTPAIGDPAPNADTPTIASAGGDAASISTASPADVSLLRDSVPELLAAQRPFVIAFATPRFCSSRLCGPTVDIMLNVQRTLRSTPLAFVHAEIYRDLDPDNGTAPWVRAWRLPTEPWVFVVDASGRITAKFEGAVTPQELEAAARAVLAP